MARHCFIGEYAWNITSFYCPLLDVTIVMWKMEYCHPLMLPSTSTAQTWMIMCCIHSPIQLPPIRSQLLLLGTHVKLSLLPTHNTSETYLPTCHQKPTGWHLFAQTCLLSNQNGYLKRAFLTLNCKENVWNLTNKMLYSMYESSCSTKTSCNTTVIISGRTKVIRRPQTVSHRTTASGYPKSAAQSRRPSLTTAMPIYLQPTQRLLFVSTVATFNISFLAVSPSCIILPVTSRLLTIF